MKNIATGICLGCTLFTIIGIVFDVAYSGTFMLSDWSYTKIAIGSIVVGLGFSIPSFVYHSDKIADGIKILIHMGTGCTVMLIVALIVGWIPVGFGWLNCIFAIACELIVAFIIWLAFYCHYKKIAKMINEKIK